MMDKTPESRLGVYQSIDDVPPHHRLANHDLGDRDIWSEYLQHKDGNLRRSEDRAIRRWNEVMDERGTHHALAEPEDVKAYTRLLVVENDYKSLTVKEYMSEPCRFYRWLLWHVEFPHRYNPVLLAATDHGPSRTAFDCYVTHYTEL
jgi:hypothetical protein